MRWLREDKSDQVGRRGGRCPGPGLEEEGREHVEVVTGGGQDVRPLWPVKDEEEEGHTEYSHGGLLNTAVIHARHLTTLICAESSFENLCLRKVHLGGAARCLST